MRYLVLLPENSCHCGFGPFTFVLFPNINEDQSSIEIISYSGRLVLCVVL